MRKARGGEGRGQTQAAMAHPARGHGLPCERMERTAREVATGKEKKNYSAGVVLSPRVSTAQHPSPRMVQLWRLQPLLP